jgi:protein phosphatase
MGHLEVCGRSDTGKRRSTNEDSLLTIEIGEFYLLAVADGLGGHAAGEVASKIAIIEIGEFLKRNLAEQGPLDAFKGAIEKANREIYLLSRENQAYAGMGSTVVAAMVQGHEALIANVGDSRAYLVDGGIEQVTRDHSLAQELVDKGIVTKEEAIRHPQRHIVTRTLGTQDTVAPDFKVWDLKGKTLLLCSDGLTDSLQEEEIRDTVLGSAELDRGCVNLIDLANQKGASDNITVILAREAG